MELVEVDWCCCEALFVGYCEWVDWVGEVVVCDFYVLCFYIV